MKDTNWHESIRTFNNAISWIQMINKNENVEWKMESLNGNGYEGLVNLKWRYKEI